MEEVKALIEPGDSAIFAMLRIVVPDVVAEQFRGYGGTILRTTLSPEQQAKVENVLRA